MQFAARAVVALDGCNREDPHLPGGGPGKYSEG
jgi:hypothetical protein